MRTNFILLALAMLIASFSGNAKVEQHCTTHKDANGVLVRTCKGKVSTKHHNAKTHRKCTTVTGEDGKKVTHCEGKTVKVHK